MLEGPNSLVGGTPTCPKGRDREYNPNRKTDGGEEGVLLLTTQMSIAQQPSIQLRITCREGNQSVPVLIPKVLCPEKPISLVQIKTVGHSA